MDAHWQSEFRGRMQKFGSAELDRFIPIFFKVRATTGCFDRLCCPHANKKIEEYLANAEMPGVRWNGANPGPETVNREAERPAPTGVGSGD